VSAPVTLVVLAKAPVPGRVKTRCCPPCTPEQAAGLAEAALADTLAVVAATPADRRVLVLDGEPGPWLPGGVEVLAQRGASLDERLAAAFDDVGGPALLIGMDTPQVTRDLLVEATARLLEAGTDAVLGPAADGGFWAIGLRRPDRDVFVGVPMSRHDTGARQRARLRARRQRVQLLPTLTDVDDMASARAVAGLVPSSRFAAACRRITATAA
jgi:rSAM/selenodomain-associated transferase 1